MHQHEAVKMNQRRSTDEGISQEFPLQTGNLSSDPRPPKTHKHSLGPFSHVPGI